MACVLQQLCETNDTKEVQGRTDIKGVQSRFSAASLPVITIYDYLVRIFTYAECSPACFILALIYIDRVIMKGGQGLIVNSKTIHRLLVTSIMVSAKFIDDVYLSNAHYARMGGIGNKELNKLELDFLFYIEFSLLVPPAIYQQYRSEIGRHASLHVHKSPPMKSQPSVCSMFCPQNQTSDMNCSSSSSGPSSSPSFSPCCSSPSTSSVSSSISNSACFSSLSLFRESDSFLTAPFVKSPSDVVMKRINSSPCLGHMHHHDLQPLLSRVTSSPCLSRLRNQVNHSEAGEPTKTLFSHQEIHTESEKDTDATQVIINNGVATVLATHVGSPGRPKGMNEETFQHMETFYPVPHSLKDINVHSAKTSSSPSSSSSPKQLSPKRKFSSPICREYTGKEQSPLSAPCSPPSSPLTICTESLDKDSRGQKIRDQKKKGDLVLCDQTYHSSQSNQLFIQIPSKDSVSTAGHDKLADGALCDVDMVDGSSAVDTCSGRDRNYQTWKKVGTSNGASNGTRTSKSARVWRRISNETDESSFGPVRRRSFSRSSPTTRNPKVARRMSASASSLRYSRFGGEYDRRMSATTSSISNVQRPCVNGLAQ